MALISVVIAVVFLVIMDVIIIAKKGMDSSISWQMYQVSRKYPVIPFLFGLVCGHIFWTQIP